MVQFLFHNIIIVEVGALLILLIGCLYAVVLTHFLFQVLLVERTCWLRLNAPRQHHLVGLLDYRGTKLERIYVVGSDNATCRRQSFIVVNYLRLRLRTIIL